MHTVKKILLYLLAAPLVIFYAISILFFYVNGVTGADKWVKNFWEYTGHWSMLLLLSAGMIFWICLLLV